MKNTLPVLLSWLCLSSLVSSNNDVQSTRAQSDLARVLKFKIIATQELARSGKVVDSVKKQNSKKVDLNVIKRIDREWVNSGAETILKKSYYQTIVGQYFMTIVDFNDSIYSEIFLCDDQGALVAAYPPTSDYWQGDEDKWIKAICKGTGNTYIGPIEFDESTQTNAVQISVPVKDGGLAIGVLTMGIKLNYFQAKLLK